MVRRFVVVGWVGLTRALAGIERQGERFPGFLGRRIHGVHWSVVRGRLDVGTEYSHQHYGVLALVGRTSLGRRNF